MFQSDAERVDDRLRSDLQGKATDNSSLSPNVGGFTANLVAISSVLTGCQQIAGLMHSGFPIFGGVIRAAR